MGIFVGLKVGRSRRTIPAVLFCRMVLGLDVELIV